MKMYDLHRSRSNDTTISVERNYH